MPEDKNDHDELKRLLEENIKVTKENNTYLRKLYRNSMISGVFQIIWYAILIGLPFALYYYILGPYFEALGSNFETFRQGMEEVPGIKGFDQILH